MTTVEVETVAAAVAILGGLYALLVPARKALVRRRNIAAEHHLDHAGRPARFDPSTGAEIAPAQPGLASALQQIQHRQVEVIANVQAIREHVSGTTDNTEAINEIRDMLKAQASESDRRHAENRAANAETRAEVADLRVSVQTANEQAREAAADAKDAAGHAARLGREQKEMAESIEQRFAEHQVVEQAYVRALGELGVQVEPSTARA